MTRRRETNLVGRVEAEEAVDAEEGIPRRQTTIDAIFGLEDRKETIKGSFKCHDLLNVGTLLGQSLENGESLWRGGRMRSGSSTYTFGVRTVSHDLSLIIQGREYRRCSMLNDEEMGLYDLPLRRKECPEQLQCAMPYVECVLT
jgi:hypothetical protein